MSKNSKPNVYDFLDYREYLRKFYEEKKLKNSQYSYTVLSSSAGFKSRNFIRDVINRNKNLSRDSIFKLQNVLKLNKNAFQYFQDIIAYNQSKKSEEKNFYLEKILGYKQTRKVRHLIKEQYEFYSKWHHNSVRELVVMDSFRDNYQKIGKTLQPQINAEEVKKSIKLLLQLGLLKKKGWKYVQTDVAITTGDEVDSDFIRNFHMQNLFLAREAIDFIPEDERDLSCLVLALSKDKFQQIKREVQKFRKAMANIADEEKNPTDVYHLSFQFFPTTKNKGTD